MSIVLALLFSGSALAAPPKLLPLPSQLTEGQGSFRLTRSASIAVPRNDRGAMEAARQFARLLTVSNKLALKVGQGRGAVRFVRKPGFAREAYELTASPRGMTITASSDAGLLYGAITAWQLATGDRPNVIPAVTIKDAPKFPWRGLMLDSARHFQSPDYIRRLIDWMAVNKLNVLHWHLVDDQGWRLEIKKYPRLTEVSAWRIPATAPSAPRLPRVGGFYTQEQVREIVAYAAKRNVTIVPEIEMPGHALSAIRAYPEFGTGAAIPAGVESDWGVFPWLYNVDDGTFTFLADVLGEVLTLFPSQYIHVGGDEAVKDQWKASPKIQAQMRALGIKDEHALQSWFMSRIGKFLAARGRRMIGWDEILEGGIPPDATITSWRGIDGAVAAAKAGHDSVLSPAPTLYFDNRQGFGASEPPGRGNLVDLKTVYGFDPSPAGLTAEQQRHILGLQGNLWTEHVRTEDRASWNLFPRASAVAEIGWSHPARPDFADFVGRLAPQMKRMKAIGLKPAPIAYATNVEPTSLSVRRRSDEELKTCTDKVRLALEDDYPAQGTRAVFLTDIFNPCWIFEKAPLAGVTQIAIDVGQVPFNFQISAAERAGIHFRPPATPAGEFEARAGGCDGESIAVLPLAPAEANPGVTRLIAPIAPRSGVQDLCITYTANGVNPMWAIDAVELVAE